MAKRGNATLGSYRPSATDVSFEKDCLVVLLDDGRSLSVSLEWFPTLRDATDAQRNNWELLGGGIGIHWEELDEDLSVAGLLNPSSHLQNDVLRRWL